jgi:hypothetical protein
MRLRVEYADQNESFASYLPRTGQTVRSFTSDKGTVGWLLLRLDEPFEYQLKVGDGFRLRIPAIVITGTGAS